MAIHEHHAPAALVDRFGRRVSYLRISITDRCDFRCVYCMAEEMSFLPRAQILTLEEIHWIARAFVECGVDKIRITGGEPLVRKGALELMTAIAELPGLRELLLSTNGSQLAQKAEDLRRAGVRRVNISLDSLDEERFRRMTRMGELKKVLDGVDASLAAGFEGIKLNAVILKNRNHDEVCDLVDFAVRKGVDISFIEEMPLGLIDAHDRTEEYYSSEQVKRDIEQMFTLSPSTDKTGGPSRYFRVGASKTRVGFISPHSHNFCGSCNRVRLTCEGRLLLCLGNEHSVDLKRLIRANPGDMERLKSAVVEAMGIKPERHFFNDLERPVILRHMSMTGG
jgi:GTP 3',8-cyclase